MLLLQDSSTYIDGELTAKISSFESEVKRNFKNILLEEKISSHKEYFCKGLRCRPCCFWEFECHKSRSVW